MHFKDPFKHSLGSVTSEKPPLLEFIYIIDQQIHSIRFSHLGGPENDYRQPIPQKNPKIDEFSYLSGFFAVTILWAKKRSYAIAYCFLVFS